MNDRGRWALSMSVTSTPSSANVEAYSQAMTPPPKTVNERGYGEEQDRVDAAADGLGGRSQEVEAGERRDPDRGGRDGPVWTRTRTQVGLGGIRIARRVEGRQIVDAQPDRGDGPAGVVVDPAAELEGAGVEDAGSDPVRIEVRSDQGLGHLDDEAAEDVAEAAVRGRGGPEDAEKITTVQQAIDYVNANVKK